MRPAKIVLTFFIFFLFVGCGSDNKSDLKPPSIEFSTDKWKEGTKPVELKPWMKEMKDTIFVLPENLPKKLPPPENSQNFKIVLNKTSEGNKYYVLEWFCSSYSDAVKGYIPRLLMRGWKIEEEKHLTSKKSIFQMRRKGEGMTLIVSKMPLGYFWKVRLSTFTSLPVAENVVKK